MTTLHVHTRNSLYRIIVSAGDAVLVEGGEFFPSLTPAHFSGASVGGSFLKVGWIGIGLRMEILVDGRRIVTSPVRDISTAGSRQQPRALTPSSDILKGRTPEPAARGRPLATGIAESTSPACNTSTR